MCRLFIIIATYCVVQSECIPLESNWDNDVNKIQEYGTAVEREAEKVLRVLQDKSINMFKYVKGYIEEKLPELEDGKHFFNKEVKNIKREMHSVEKFHHHSATGGCQCSKYTCGCCEYLEEPSIHLNSTICANATYLDEDIGISLTVTVNEYAIFNETVSVRNPPPVCLGVPYVKEWAEACVRLYDINATRVSLHACAQVEARMKHILIAKYELGCFNIGPQQLLAADNQEMDNEVLPHVVLV